MKIYPLRKASIKPTIPNINDYTLHFPSIHENFYQSILGIENHYKDIQNVYDK